METTPPPSVCLFVCDIISAINPFGRFSLNSVWWLFIKNFPSKHEFRESRSNDSCVIHRDVNEFLAVLCIFIELFCWNSIRKFSHKTQLNYEFHEYRFRKRPILFRSLMNLYTFFASLFPEFGSKSIKRDLHIILFRSFKCHESRRRKWRIFLMSVNEITCTFLSRYLMISWE